MVCLTESSTIPSVPKVSLLRNDVSYVYSLIVELAKPVVYHTVVKFTYVWLELSFILLLVTLRAVNLIVNTIELTFAQ